jgi:hypothetical protein
MNRTKALKILKAYGRPTFARQSEPKLKEIENKTDDELITEWKSLVWMNEIYGQVSLNDMQRISLIELEIDDRKDIKDEDLKSWYDKELENFNIDDVK